MEVVESFDKFKEYLREKVFLAEKLGFSDETIARGVNLVQTFLSKIVEPENAEERLLQKLWVIGNREERNALSHLLLKLVKEDYTDSNEETKH